MRRCSAFALTHVVNNAQRHARHCPGKAGRPGRGTALRTVLPVALTCLEMADNPVQHGAPSGGGSKQT